MILINLLPWREELREKQKKLFFLSLGISLTSALVIIIFTYLYLENGISSQRQRNQILSNEIARYDRQIQEIKRLKKVRQALIARMNIIQQLQENRPTLVHFFDELIKILPGGVHFTKVVRSGDEVVMIGQSGSNSEVSQLMRNIENNYWLHYPVLEEIKEVKELNRDRKTEIFDEFRLKSILKSKHSMKIAL